MNRVLVITLGDVNAARAMVSVTIKKGLELFPGLKMPITLSMELEEIAGKVQAVSTEKDNRKQQSLFAQAIREYEMLRDRVKQEFLFELRKEVPAFYTRVAELRLHPSLGDCKEEIDLLIAELSALVKNGEVRLEDAGTLYHEIDEELKEADVRNGIVTISLRLRQMKVDADLQPRIKTLKKRLEKLQEYLGDQKGASMEAGALLEATQNAFDQLVEEQSKRECDRSLARAATEAVRKDPASNLRFHTSAS